MLTGTNLNIGFKNNDQYLVVYSLVGFGRSRRKSYFFMINMIKYVLKLLVCSLLLVEFTCGTEIIEVEIDDDPSPSWPADLSTSSQVVFRPLFVYKQKKASQIEKNRRKAEFAIEVLEKERKPIRIPYRPPYYYNPNPSYYYNHNYRPYYYNYYPYYHSY